MRNWGMWGKLGEEKFKGDIGGETGCGDTLGEDDDDPAELGDEDLKHSSLIIVRGASISLCL